MKRTLVLTTIFATILTVAVAIASQEREAKTSGVDNTTLKQRMDLLIPLLGEPKLDLREIPFNDTFWTRVELTWKTSNGEYSTGVVIRLPLDIIEARGKDWISKEILRQTTYYHDKASWVTVIKGLK